MEPQNMETTVGVVELDILRRVAWGVVHNVKGPGLRWAAVAKATGLGSTSASALCVAHGLDPNEGLKRTESDQ